MAGHSHWAGIKHKKAAADAKRGKAYSKLITLITIAARAEPNPEFNPRLRSAIEKARAEQVPNDTIERALKRATDPDNVLEEITFEAYGPGGIAILIDTATDNRNRTVQEVKKILSDNKGKWAEMGSVRWAFEGGKAKFPQSLSPEDSAALAALVAALESHGDVQGVTTNAQ